MATEKKNPTMVVTGKVRLSYAHLYEPHAAEEGQTPKYGTAILIKKSDKYTLDRLEAAIAAAKELYKTKFGEGKLPPASKFKLPLRDGDEEKEGEADYKGMYFMNCNSDNKPGLVDKDLNPILDKGTVYSGCFCRVSINLFPFKNKSMGIGVGLNNVQFLEDGPSLGGGTKAEDDFAEEFDEESAKATVTKTRTSASKKTEEDDEDDPES